MDRKIILFLLLGLFLISFASASSPNLIDGTQGLPSLDTAPLSNNTYNVNYSVVLTNSSYVTYANWNATNTSYFDLNKANTAGAFNQTFDTNTFFIDAVSNRVGIGTTTPSDKLTVAGDINVSGCFELSNGTIIGGSCVSDIDTKKNLQNYSIDLNELLSLSPKKFEYKNTSILAGVEEYQECEENKFDENGTLIEEGKCLNKTQNVYYDFPEGVQIGFIAEEVELYYPEWITLDKFGFKRITYGMNWIFELWKQNQEQQKEINMLKKELCLKDNTYSWCIK